MIRILLMNLDFRVAASATGTCGAQTIVGNWAASGVAEFWRPVIGAAAHTVVPSFLLSATSDILEVLSKWLIGNVIPRWRYIFQVLRE